MIRYTLRCERGHSFESWFQSGAAYENQAKRKLVECPSCGSVTVEKAIMAPQIARKDRGRNAPTDAVVAAPAEKMTATVPASPASLMMAKETELRAKLRELRAHIVKNADDVGSKFAEEARKMHYGETPHRAIYGEASAQEARDMIDEGLEVAPLPTLPDDRN